MGKEAAGWFAGRGQGNGQNRAKKMEKWAGEG